MKGILFKPDMIQAIVEGRKTQTRRLSGLKEINKEPDKWELTRNTFGTPMEDGSWRFGHSRPNFYVVYIKPRYQVGEVVYIKEAWATEKQYDHLKPSEIPHTAKIFYVSGGVGEWPINLPIGKLRSPLFMPAWAARHLIKFTDVKAQRLQEITEGDAVKEGTPINDFFPVNTAAIAGLSTVDYYAELWDTINPKYPFESNCWVFAYSFNLRQEIPESRYEEV